MPFYNKLNFIRKESVAQVDHQLVHTCITNVFIFLKTEMIYQIFCTLAHTNISYTFKRSDLLLDTFHGHLDAVKMNLEN